MNLAASNDIAQSLMKINCQSLTKTDRFNAYCEGIFLLIFAYLLIFIMLIFRNMSRNPHVKGCHVKYFCFFTGILVIIGWGRALCSIGKGDINFF